MGSDEWSALPLTKERFLSTSILDRLKQGPVLVDDGYLLALENRGYVQAGPFTPEVTIEHPNALRALHKEFVHDGVFA